MTYQQELELIRKQHRGVLKPTDVVNYAKNAKTALHKKFIWDNTEAAKRYRLWQARQLIAFTITVETPDVPEHHTYVSMRQDRSKPGGGYRATIEVMSEEKTRAQLLKDALAEFQDMKRRYGHLKELAIVFEAIDKIK